MRAFLAIAILALLLGCTAPTEPQNATAPDGSDLKLPDERAFVYDIGRNASPAVARTIARTTDSPDDAHNVFGTVNLKVSDCHALGDEYYKGRCLQSAAVYLSDDSLCGSISESYRPYCYYELAVKNRNSSMCAMAGEVSTACRRQIAAISGDPSLCASGPSEPNGAKKEELCRSVASSGLLKGKDECSEDLAYSLLVEYEYFGDAIGWLSANHPGEKVLSWWDYGTALDCMGLQSIISQENLEDPAIQDVAHLLVAANESELSEYMESAGARYLMVDNWLVSSGGTLGGKYGALNYLSCVRDGKTTAVRAPGDSECESDNLWEVIFISEDPCQAGSGKDGFIAYKLYDFNNNSLAYYPDFCMSPSDMALADYCRNQITAVPAYCVANVTIAGGQQAYGTYTLESGRATALSKGQIGLTYRLPETASIGPVTAATLFYTHDRIWIENGTYVEGYGDRTSTFYDSVVYKAMFLDSLEGFTKVYEDPSGTVKIFEREE
ncbi:MAG: hypothetical protein AB1324_02060 [Candidatus Micrarchaeota archaeon]